MSPARTRAPLVEVFGSIQGEGRFVGVPMCFLRVAVCPIRCRYCDTPHSYVPAPFARIRARGPQRDEPNPVSAARAAELVAEVGDASAFGAIRTVSITGGEPLLYPAFVREAGALLRARGFRVHLETAALDAEAFAEALPAVHHLSADYKLPETLAQGEHEEAHLGCVARAVAAGISVDVKIVLTRDVADASLARALDALVPYRERIVLVLQPVTPFGAVRETVTTEQLARATASARERGFDLRVLPQAHRMLGVE